MKTLRLVSVLSIASAAIAIVVACGGSDGDSPSNGATTPPADAGPRGMEQAGQACTTATQCYGAVADAGGEGGAAALVKGTITCLDRVTNGYCTHTCNDDSDCCAAPGECRTGVKQVCAPFTNESATKYCFLSCETGDISAAIAANADAGYYDGGAADGGVENAYCQSYASIYATCRSTGGGKQNRKVCIPQQ
jgi:hypothetical protein